MQGDNQNISLPSVEASLTSTHGEHQALDVTIAANVSHSLQHDNQGYAGVIAAELELGVHPQPSTSTSNSTLAQFGIAETDGTGGEASSASADDRQVSGDGSAELDMRLWNLPKSGIGRSEPDQQHFPDHLGVLPDGHVHEVHPGETALINQVSGIAAIGSGQASAANGLFLSDFM
jgi:hypothetical protein